VCVRLRGTCGPHLMEVREFGTRGANFSNFGPGAPMPQTRQGRRPRRRPGGGTGGTKAATTKGRPPKGGGARFSGPWKKKPQEGFFSGRGAGKMFGGGRRPASEMALRGGKRWPGGRWVGGRFWARAVFGRGGQTRGEIREWALQKNPFAHSAGRGRAPGRNIIRVPVEKDWGAHASPTPPPARPSGGDRPNSGGGAGERNSRGGPRGGWGPAISIGLGPDLQRAIWPGPRGGPRERVRGGTELGGRGGGAGLSAGRGGAVWRGGGGREPSVFGGRTRPARAFGREIQGSGPGMGDWPAEGVSVTTVATNNKPRRGRGAVGGPEKGQNQAHLTGPPPPGGPGEFLARSTHRGGARGCGVGGGRPRPPQNWGAVCGPAGERQSRGGRFNGAGGGGGTGRLGRARPCAPQGPWNKADAGFDHTVSGIRGAGNESSWGKRGSASTTSG